MSRRTPAPANEGIHATTVTADVIAVGRGARAKKIVHGADDQAALRDAIAALRQGIDAMRLASDARQKVEAEVVALERVSPSTKPEQARSRLADLMTTLKTVGVAVSDVVGLVDPIRKIFGI
jgi:hypothetical protein